MGPAPAGGNANDVPAVNDSLTDGSLARVAERLDQAAAEPSRYRRFELARELFLESGSAELRRGADGSLDPGESGGFDDLDDFDDPDDRAAAALPLLESAAWAAMRYHVEFTIDNDKERARLVPHFVGPDNTDPIDTDLVPDEVVAAWVDLSAAVQSAPARALLSHLAFQAGKSGRREHAQDALNAYLEVTNSELRVSDAVHSARVAVRLARAVGDHDGLAVSLRTLEGAAEKAITGPSRSVGAARDALGTLIRERADARRLVDLACAAWSGEHIEDLFWRLKLRTAADSADLEDIWRCRVEHSIARAERSTSNILRATRLREAAALAEESGFGDLRERTAVLLQGIRNVDLEMIRITASTFRFEEQLEETIASVLLDKTAAEVVPENRRSSEARDPADPRVQGEDPGSTTELPTWYRRLLAFAHFQAPTGDPDANREVVEHQHRLAPLQAYFPKQLQTPEGLPLYAPATTEERFDLDVVEWETELLAQWTPIMAEALHRVVTPDLPPFGDLVHVLGSGPASDEGVGRQLAASLYRYWSGDGQGAVYTAVPMLEAMVRNAVLDADRGIYRLQRKQVPGQYVGLGVLLDLFVESYAVDRRDERFFGALLKHPGGWNLRNKLAHGYLPDASGGLAAIVLYAAMRILVLCDEGANQVAVKEGRVDE